MRGEWLILAAALGCNRLAPESAGVNVPLRYPDSPRGAVVETYHGVAVPDPYRWLEDPDAPEVRTWIEAQNRLTRAFLDAIPGRDALRARAEQLWNYERYSLPVRKGDNTFYLRNDGLQNHDVLWVVSGEGAPRVLLDPNTLSADGTVSLAGASASEDGRYLAWGRSDGGSDWTVWRVRDVATGQDLPDEIRWAKFTTPTWTYDNAGFFYGRYPEPKDTLTAVNENNVLYYHRLGEDQSQDRQVYARPDQPGWMFFPSITADGRTLVLAVHQGTDPRNRIYLQDLDVPDAPIVPLLDDFDARYVAVGNDGDRWWFQTDNQAPRGRLVEIDRRHPAPQAWRTIIPESTEALEGVSLVGGRFIARYLKDAHSVVRTFSLDGAPLGEVALPGLGTAWGFAGRPEDTDTFYGVSSYTAPPRIYRYEVASGQSALYRSASLPFDPEDFVSEQVFVTSKDGTRVPLFLNYKRGLARDGDRPVLLYGYGGFNISLTPMYAPSIQLWMEQGGVWAVACLRGGGEYGEDWHKAGTREHKQNTFDDFIASAEYLISERWTRPARLAIKGGSNGGLLVGAVMVQRPDLFGAVLPGVGVLDMLRYHLFTIGRAWVSDYGASDDPAMFPILLGYSPVHNLKQGTAYPATLITTGDHDDRVVPAHSFKFAAALQEAQGGPAPVLIRVETRAGHGRQTPTSMRIDLVADELSFLRRALQMTP